MRLAGLSLTVLTFISGTLLGQDTSLDASRARLIARAKSLELPTKYEPVPGDPLEHHAAGYATIMCSGVFISGFEPDFVAENIGYFTAPYAERAKLGKPVIDRAARSVSVKMPNGTVRIA